MILYNLIPYIVDKVVIYQKINNEYKDIYKGVTSKIPNDILKKEIKVIGSYRKNIIEIQVK